MKLQKTIKSEARVSGKGMFGGKESKVVFRPAPSGTGVVFVRTDIAEPVQISAVVANIAERSRRTTLKKGSVSIETIEHCLAAASALGIDNLIVEVNGSEMPAPDCSSAEYFKVSSGLGWLSRQRSAKSLLLASRLVLALVMHRYMPCHMRMTA